jgi:hypothetical protein
MEALLDLNPLFLVLLGFAGLSFIVGDSKGHAILGFLLGLSMGPVGLIVTLLMPYPPRND